MALMLLYVFLALPATFAGAWRTFVVPYSLNRSVDDAPLLMNSFTGGGLSTDTTILFQRGITYNIFSPIKFPTFQNVEISIEGNLTYPPDIATVQAAVSSSRFPGAWFAFSGGRNITLRGSLDPHWGWIDGHGQAWWDAQQQINRPHGWAFSKVQAGIIRDMKLWKPIAWNFATSGSSDVRIFNNKIVAVSDTNSFPFNTDGFSAGGTNLLFENNHIQNGDDCLTVGNGAKDIHWRNSYCEGGHGLSIGSLGEGGQVADVENVLMENTVMNNTLYAARFKSWTGGNGFARNVTWRNIVFHDVPFPIYVTQNYWDQGKGPKPNATSSNNTHIENFFFEGFTGTIKEPFVEGSCVSDPCWYAVSGATGKEVVILDLYPGTAFNVLAKDLLARTATRAPVTVMCNSSTINTDVGFVCWDGPFIRTKAGL